MTTGFKFLCVLAVTLTLQPQGSAAGYYKEGVIEGCVIPCYNGGYFRHPSDCSKFVQCVPAGPVEMSCPLGTIWDQSLRTCNFAGAVACETGQYSTPDGASCNQNEEGSQTDETEEVTSIPEEGDESDESTGVPEENDDSSENESNNAEENESDSSSSEESSSSSEESEEYESDATEVEESTESNKEDESESDSTDLAEPTGNNEGDESQSDSTQLEELTEQSTAAVECNFHCPSERGFFHHPRDCSKYFMCTNWVPRELQCQTGLHFRGAFFFCDSPELAMCTASPDAEC